MSRRGTKTKKRKKEVGRARPLFCFGGVARTSYPPILILCNFATIHLRESNLRLVAVSLTSALECDSSVWLIAKAGADEGIFFITYCSMMKELISLRTALLIRFYCEYKPSKLTDRRMHAASYATGSVIGTWAPPAVDRQQTLKGCKTLCDVSWQQTTVLKHARHISRHIFPILWRHTYMYSKMSTASDQPKNSLGMGHIEQAVQKQRALGCTSAQAIAIHPPLSFIFCTRDGQEHCHYRRLRLPSARSSACLLRLPSLSRLLLRLLRLLLCLPLSTHT